jgi:hypothetical protein
MKVVVVRVGTPDHVWDTKWSSLEMPLLQNNQTVLHLFVEQHPILVVFVNTGDIPIYIARVENVRGRDLLADADYPLGTDRGLYQTFITFSHKYPINIAGIIILQTMLNSIKYIAGQQVLIDDNLALAAILLDSINHANTNTNTNVNTTFINPAYY